MADNPYVNKVVYGDQTLIDLTGDTVSPSSLKLGSTAHNASGAQITGTADDAPKRTVAYIFNETDSYSISDYVYYENKLYKCVTAHTGIWNSAHFTETTIGNELDDKAPKAYIAVQDQVPTNPDTKIWFKTSANPQTISLYTAAEVDAKIQPSPSGSGSSGDLAYINTGSTADRAYQPNDYLVYNSQLYRVGTSAIAQGATLTPDTNIIAVTNGGLNNVKALCKPIIQTVTDAIAPSSSTTIINAPTVNGYEFQYWLNAKPSGWTGTVTLASILDQQTNVTVNSTSSSLPRFFNAYAIYYPV